MLLMRAMEFERHCIYHAAGPTKYAIKVHSVKCSIFLAPIKWSLIPHSSFVAASPSTLWKCNTKMPTQANQWLLQSVGKVSDTVARRHK